MENIQDLLNEGLSFRKIGNLLGVHHTTISNRIKNGKLIIKGVKEGEKVTCTNCNREYIKDRKKGHKGIICNSCSSRKQEEKKRSIIKNIIGNSCVKCGYNKCDDVIEYHHINPKEKDFNISQYIKLSIEILKKEAGKCIPLCANCHREFHAGIFKYKDIDFDKLKDYQIKLLQCHVMELANMPSCLEGAESGNS